jgi:hypothetical protein
MSFAVPVHVGFVLVSAVVLAWDNPWPYIGVGKNLWFVTPKIRVNGSKVEVAELPIAEGFPRNGETDAKVK